MVRGGGSARLCPSSGSPNSCQQRGEDEGNLRLRRELGLVEDGVGGR